MLKLLDATCIIVKLEIFAERFLRNEQRSNNSKICIKLQATKAWSL